MKSDDLKKELLTRLKVELGNEWDANFRRRAFFTKQWAGRQKEGRGQLLDVTGTLRSSIRGVVEADRVRWYSSTPYAEIHNDGGEITVTAKMKRFFWAKYYEFAKKIKHRKDGNISSGSAKASAAAEYYKCLALMKVGDKIVIPQRQFIGDAPEVEAIVRKNVDAAMKDVETYISTILNSKK